MALIETIPKYPYPKRFKNLEEVYDYLLNLYKALGSSGGGFIEIFRRGTNNIFKPLGAAWQPWMTTGTAMQWGWPGTSNVILGKNAIASGTVANLDYGVVIGEEAGTKLTTPTIFGNPSITGVIIGYQAAQSLTTGGANTLIGSGVAPVATTAYQNTIIGHWAAPAILTGSTNVIIGQGAATDLTVGGGNIIMGFGAGVGVITGAGNVLLGGKLTADVSNAIAIGCDASSGFDNSIAIGSGAVVDATDKCRIGGAGVDAMSVEVGKQFISTMAIGTQPINVTSTTVCTNLNADMVDGYHAGSFVGSHAILDGSVHTDSLAGSVLLGDLIHGNVTPKWAKLAGNITTTKKWLAQTGTGAISAIPAWDTIATGDVPYASHHTAAIDAALTDAQAQLANLHTDASPTFDRLQSSSSFISGNLFSRGPVGIGAGLVQSANNPVIPLAMEETLLMDGNQVDAWYRNTSNNKIYYAYSTDAMAETWTIGNGGVAISDTSIELGGMYFPYVFKVGTTYYMAGVVDRALGDGSCLYLWSSADKITWVFANGGNPILHHSATVTDWWYQIWNPAIAVEGTTWHLLIDGNASGSTYVVGYSHSTLAAGPNFDTNLSALPVLAGTSCNPDLIYVPDRSALLAIYTNLTIAGSVEWQLRAATCPIASDPGLAASWTIATGFGYGVPGIIISDPGIVFSGTSNKPWKMLLCYNYDQTDGYHAYAQTTLNEFYDLVTAPTTTLNGNVNIGGKIEVDAIDLGHWGGVRIDSNSGHVHIPSLWAGTLHYRAAAYDGRDTYIGAEAGAAAGDTDGGNLILEAGMKYGGGGTAGDIQFWVGTGSTTNKKVACIKGGTGNFGIGPTTADAHVQVEASGTSNALPTLGAHFADGIEFLANGSNYGLLMGVRYSDGDSWIQAGRTAGGATAYNLLLQPVGGSVGIGMPIPGAPLGIHGGIANGLVSVIKIKAGADDTASGPALLFEHGYTGENWQAGKIGTLSVGMGVSYKQDMVFYTNTGANAANLSEKVRITNDGKVGINDPAPAEALDVTGNANVTGVYKVDDVQVVSNQQAHIVNADGTLADVTAKFNTLLTALETHGLLASA